MDPRDHLAIDVERARYRMHEAGAGNEGHRRFLSRLADPLVAFLLQAERHRHAEGLNLEGLDFGCGPLPVLASLLEPHGIRMSNWDPSFAPDPSVLARSYDLVTLTEVAEHLTNPAATFDQIEALVRPGGWIAVMTDPDRGDVSLERWYYLRDPTHVSLYRPETLEWMAQARGWRHHWLEPRVIVYECPGALPFAPAPFAAVDERPA